VKYEATWIGLAAIYLHGVSDARQTQSLWCWLPFFILLGLNAALDKNQAPIGNLRLILVPRILSAGFLMICLAIFNPISGTIL